jgi:glutamate/aspartate transport system substrate-binding protein
VKKGSPIKSFRDLAGRSVVVTTGTTNEAPCAISSPGSSSIRRSSTGRDHADSYAQLVEGKVDAFATDDVLLYGFIALNRAQDQLMVVGDFLSYDPYGIMFRKDDPQLASLVQKTLHDLAASRELEQTYNKWFLRQLPNGQRMNLPMSVQLTEIIRIMAATRRRSRAVDSPDSRSCAPPAARRGTTLLFQRQPARAVFGHFRAFG